MRQLSTLARTIRAAAALEFALICTVFVPLCLAILASGVVIWTAGALQSTVSLAARCAALSGSDCSNVPRYIVTTAENWTYPGVISTASVTPAPHTACLGGVVFMVVTITSNVWSSWGINVSAQTWVAYYPVPTSACS